MVAARIFVLSDGTSDDNSIDIERELSVIQALLSYPATHIDAIYLFIPDDLVPHLPTCLTNDTRLRVRGYNATSSTRQRKSAVPSILQNSTDNLREMTAFKKQSRATTVTLNLLSTIAREEGLPSPKGIVTTSIPLLAALTLSERHRNASVFLLASNTHGQMSYFPHSSQSTTAASRAAYLMHQTYHVANASRRLHASPDDDHWHSITHVTVYRERYFGTLPQLNKWRRRRGMNDLTQLAVVNSMFGAPPVHVIVNVPEFLIPRAAPPRSNANLLMCVGHLVRREQSIESDEKVPVSVTTFVGAARAVGKTSRSKLVTVVIDAASNATSLHPSASSELADLKAGGATHVLFLISSPSSSSSSSYSKPSRTNKQLQSWIRTNVHVCTVHPTSLPRALTFALRASSCAVCDGAMQPVVAAITTGVPLVVTPSSPTQTFWATLVTLRGLAITGRPSDIKVLIDAALSQRMLLRAQAAAHAFCESLADDSDERNDSARRTEANSSSQHGVSVDDCIARHGAKAVAQLIVDKTF